ncbi:MAG: antitoxin, partial [Pseudonocardia sp.]|nr:antitoxin [Pseudonocardia sp.]
MDLNNLAGKAGELLNEHGDKVEDAVDKVAEIAKEKFGHGEQIDMAVDKVKDMIPDGPAA